MISVDSLQKILFIEHTILVIVAIFSYRERERFVGFFEFGQCVADHSIGTRREFGTVGTSRDEQNRTDKCSKKNTHDTDFTFLKANCKSGFLGENGGNCSCANGGKIVIPCQLDQ